MVYVEFMMKNHITKISKQRKFGLGLLVLAIIILIIFATWYFAEKNHYFTNVPTINSGHTLSINRNI